MKTENEQLADRILFGLEKSYQNLIAEKRRKNEDLIVLRNNRIIRIQP